MNKKEREVVDKVLKKYVKDKDLIRGIEYELLKATVDASLAHTLVLTDLKFNFIKEYEAVSLFIFDFGFGPYLNKTSVIGAIKEKTCRYGDILVHRKVDYLKGDYSNTINNKFYSELVEKEDYLLHEGTGVMISKGDEELFKDVKVRIHSYGYAMATVGVDKTYSFHRYLLGLHLVKETRVVDHIDGNPLNNRRENLRLCHQKYNTLNRRPNKPTNYTPTSKYMGVSKHSKTSWALETSVMKQRIRGKFKCERRAAVMYDIVQLALAKQYAYTNFPRESYDPEVVKRFRSLHLKKYRDVDS